MTQDTVRKIYDKIFELSNESKIIWELPNTGQHNVLRTEINEYYIVFSKSELSVNFTIYNILTGVELGSMRANMITESELNRKMVSFFDSVIRKVLKIDEGLEDFLSKLSNL